MSEVMNQEGRSRQWLWNAGLHGFLDLTSDGFEELL